MFISIYGLHGVDRAKKEIPFLKEVEKAYHGKNIEFVSISVD